MPFVELLVPQVLQADPAEVLGREPRQLRKPHRPVGVQRVADGELPRVHQADHVAGIGDGNRLAVAAEEPERPRRPQRAPAAAVEQHHVLLEPAGTDPQEGDAIAMPRIHVRLDLEDVGGEARIGRDDQLAVFGLARLRRRRQVDQRAEERLEPEIGQRAAEEHRRLPALQVFRGDRTACRRSAPGRALRARCRARSRRSARRLPGSSSEVTCTGARYCPCAWRS